MTKTNTMRLPAYGNVPDGTLTTKLTYQHATASAAASTGNTIGLGKGAVFTLTTCVAYHLQGAAPVSSCADRIVDTRANAATIYTYAPSVTLSGQPRPTGSAAWGYFTAYSHILMQYNGATSFAGHTWPDDGLQGAGLPVAAQAATAATLPPNQTVTLHDLAYNGQINSGQADSICRPQPMAANGTALPPGVVSSHPGFAGAPAYYEVGLPTGAYAGQAPRGAMLVIHGGGWVTTGTGAVQASRAEADRWRARGFETVNFTYRGCGLSIADATWFYDKARARFGASAKICATGISAGGHLALHARRHAAGRLLRRQPGGADGPARHPGPARLRRRHRHAWPDAGAGAGRTTSAPPRSGRRTSPRPARRRRPRDRCATRACCRASPPTTISCRGRRRPRWAMPSSPPTRRRTSTTSGSRRAPRWRSRTGARRQAALADYYAREVQLVSPILGSTIPLNLR